MKSSKKADTPGLNILSYIRVRPISDKEKKSHHLEFGRKEITIKGPSIKTLTYDRVFEEDAKQISVYNTVVHPMIKEVLQGYNCTVFAYGQTGTGKTHTMTGHPGSSDGSLVDNVEAGIIPRAMDEIFKELQMTRADYQVAVQYIELYNEKLRSLLSNNNEDTNVQLIDLPEGGVFIKGVPLTPVQNKDDAFRFLCQGAERRQMASTLVNENSSRSHTIFVITVKIKETVIAEQEDVVRVGKLYLVDLAGSENVSKSGANIATNKSGKGQNQRLAEASNINKSLLTLGRVITCLTENNSHVPYRESKLTRILRDSLGGKTKTCIIGTISPCQSNIDETESTLNYACKARSIKNKPEKNQTISKKEFIQVASEEILKLKRDLEAVRQGDGFYISQETHEEMCSNMRALETQVQDWNDRYNKLNASYEEKKIILDSLSDDFADKCAEYEELDQIFKSEEKKFKQKVAEIEKEILVREYLLKEYEKTEDKLTNQAKTCKTVLENLVHNSGLLHDKIDRKKTNEYTNVLLLDEFKETISNQIKAFKNEMTEFYAKETAFYDEFSQFTKCNTDRLNEEYKDLFNRLEEFNLKTMNCSNEAGNNCSLMVEKMDQELQHHSSLISENAYLQSSTLQSLLHLINPAFEQIFQHFMLISRFLENGSQKLKEHAESRKKFENEATDLINKWEISTQRILNDFSLLRKNAEEALISAFKTKDDDRLLVEKAKELIKLSEEMFKLSEKSYANSLRTEDEIKTTIESSENAKIQILKEVNSCQATSTNLFENVMKLTTYNTKVQEELMAEVKPLLEKALDEKNVTVQNIEEAVKNSCETLQKHSSLTEANVNNLNETVNGYYKVIKGNIQQSQTLSEEFVKSCTTQLKENEGVHEKSLRSQHDHVHHNKDNILSNETYITSAINGFKSTVSYLVYKEDTPLGITPQRKTIQNLQYPSQFQCTAPRAVLEQKFHEENELAAASIDPPVSTELEDDMEKPAENQISSLLPLQKRCTNNMLAKVPSKKPPKLRRSNSVPHLKTEEEKENRRETILASRRQELRK